MYVCVYIYIYIYIYVLHPVLSEIDVLAQWGGVKLLLNVSKL